MLLSQKTEKRDHDVVAAYTNDIMCTSRRLVVYCAREGQSGQAHLIWDNRPPTAWLSGGSSFSSSGNKLTYPARRVGCGNGRGKGRRGSHGWQNRRYHGGFHSATKRLDCCVHPPYLLCIHTGNINITILRFLDLLQKNYTPRTVK